MKSQNGRDTYAVAFAFQTGPGSIEIWPIMVEAVSKEEAYGLGDRAAREMLRSVPRLGRLILVQVGVSDKYIPGVTGFTDGDGK